MKQVRKSSLKQLLLKGQKPPSKNLEIMKAVAGLEGWLLPPGCPTCPMTDRQTGTSGIFQRQSQPRVMEFEA